MELPQGIASKTLACFHGGRRKMGAWGAPKLHWHLHPHVVWCCAVQTLWGCLTHVGPLDLESHQIVWSLVRPNSSLYMLTGRVTASCNVSLTFLSSHHAPRNVKTIPPPISIVCPTRRGLGMVFLYSPRPDCNRSAGAKVTAPSEQPP